MNYRAKRNAKRISFYTMCKHLGLDKKKYLEVEQGKRNLEGNLVEKYQEVIDNAASINFERNIKMAKVNEWLSSGEALEQLKKMNYTQASLARALDTHPATICRVFKNKPDMSDDPKEEVYDFLNDNLNKNIEDPVKRGSHASSIKELLKTSTSDEQEEKTEDTSKELIIEPKIVNVDDKDEYIKKLERQIMLYEKLIMKL